MALVHNGSMMIALLLGWLFVQEALTPAKLTGSGFIVVGLPVHRVRLSRLRAQAVRRVCYTDLFIKPA